MRLFLLASLLLLSAVGPIGPANAHPGGLNAEGCHNDRKNGGYHCHRGSEAADRAMRGAPIQGAAQPISRTVAPRGPPVLRRSAPVPRAIARGLIGMATV